MRRAGATMNEDLVKATEKVTAELDKAEEKVTELVKAAGEKAVHQMKDATQRAEEFAKNAGKSISKHVKDGEKAMEDFVKNASNALSKPIKHLTDDVRKVTETSKNFAHDQINAVAKEAHKILEHTCDKSNPGKCISDVSLPRLALTLMLSLMLFWPKLIFGLFTNKTSAKEGAGLLDNILCALGLSNVIKNESKEKSTLKPENDVQLNSEGNAQPK